jgi:hypothetical protein
METSMAFERLLIRVHGQQNGYQTAGQFGNPRARNDWLRKTYKLMLKDVDAIDAASRQKQMLMRDLQAAIDGLSSSNNPTWEMTFSLISACARFLGYDYGGARVSTPSYWQTAGQKFTQSVVEKTEQELDKVKDDALTIRAKLCADLHSKGTDTFTIALALNTSEYQVKKLIREGRRNSSLKA